MSFDPRPLVTQIKAQEAQRSHMGTRYLVLLLTAPAIRPGSMQANLDRAWEQRHSLASAAAMQGGVEAARRGRPRLMPRKSNDASPSSPPSENSAASASSSSTSFSCFSSTSVLRYHGGRLARDRVPGLVPPTTMHLLPQQRARYQTFPPRKKN